MKAWGIFLRSLAIQSLWNYRKMQNTGFYFALQPYFAPELERDRSAFKAFTERHLGFFNTHPYMASGIAGIAANMEKEWMAKGATAAASITAAKTSLSSVCAALGDRFFWGAVRPFLLLLALVIFYFPGTSPVALIPVAAFLILYNVIHFYIRAGFFYAGWKHGMHGVGFLNRLDLGRKAARVQKAAFCLTVAFIVIVLAGDPGRIPLYLVMLVVQVGFAKRMKTCYLVYITMGLVILLHMKGVY